jgi:hypothetical protein
VNPETRLHDASSEVERVAAAMTPPPIAQLRRVARRRSAGVAVAAALGAVVLVGGAALALRPGSASGPAAPVTTTATTEPAEDLVVDGIPVVIPAQDPFPTSWTPEGAAFAFRVAEDLSGDIGAARAQFAILDGTTDEVVVLGGLRQFRAYVFEGSYSQMAECFVILGAARVDCGPGPDAGDPWIINSFIGSTATNSSDRTIGVAGRAPQGASVVVLDIDGTRRWVRTRNGYFFIAGDGTDTSAAQYEVYDVAGSVLTEAAIQTGPGEPVVTTTSEAPDDGSCSGTAFTPKGYATGDLPGPVVEMLGEIVRDASTCSFADLAAAAGDINVSFGGGGPVEVWTAGEEQGYAPMESLLRVIAMPHATIEGPDGPIYVWPSAFAYDTWDAVPAADRDALYPLYDEADQDSFAQFGSYIGYRLGITADGDWLFFVAGD